ncbi:MAG: tetratricopeptide repeat protein [Gemmatimonadota bacterium]
MSWWSRLLGGRSDSELKPQRLDYLTEALALEKQGDLDAALTSYRLALRDKPDDHRVLVNMAIAYTRLGRGDEAVRCYRRVLEVQPAHPGAHYGLAFLLLRRHDHDGAESHLRAFLSSPPENADPRNVEHARLALESLPRSRDRGVGGGTGTEQPGIES